MSSDDIKDAISRLKAGEDAPNFANSRDYDVLLDDGVRLAPKKVFGLALERALGIKTKPVNFSAGWGQPCFVLIEAAGFAIVPKNSSNAASRAVAEKISDAVPPPPEDVVFIEGDRRMAKHFRVERSRDAKAPKLKRQQVLEMHDRLICERCESDQLDRYHPAIVDRIFEIHHKVPLGSVDEAQEVRLQDLECLCASCHRAVHRAMALGLELPDAASIKALQASKAKHESSSDG